MSDRDKFLTEAMGECWHEWRWVGGNGRSCKNCDIDLYGDENPTYSQIIETPDNPDFSTWVGFGKLWEWAVDQEWWNNFVDESGLSSGYVGESCREYEFKIVNPGRFATAIYEYLKCASDE